MLSMLPHDVSISSTPSFLHSNLSGFREVDTQHLAEVEHIPSRSKTMGQRNLLCVSSSQDGEILAASGTVLY